MADRATKLASAVPFPQGTVSDPAARDLRAAAERLRHVSLATTSSHLTIERRTARGWSLATLAASVGTLRRRSGVR